jgi:hypothetical protein
MSARKIRRAEAHAARKAARKAGFPISTSSSSVAPSTPTPSEAELAAMLDHPSQSRNILEDIKAGHVTPEPWVAHLSAARLAANKANAMLSRGPLSPATKAISAQNHTVHGLARHQEGNFKLLTSESAANFEALQKALVAEHQPLTETESILVNRMAESHWLENRAQRLQDTCMDSDTGAVTDEKKFSLYMRYKNTHTRAFHKCLNDLLKLRAEKRKAELGVEAQRVESEKHELNKELHSWELVKKDAAACRELAQLSSEKFAASQQNPDFHVEYATELAKRGLESNIFCGAVKAA